MPDPSTLTPDQVQAQEDFNTIPGVKVHTKGMPPLDVPILAKAIETRLRDQLVDRNLAADTRLRCSDAYACARKIAFSSLGVPKDVAYSRESLIAFRAGDAYHHIAQEAAVASLDARCEYPVDWTPVLSLSGHCDGVYTLGQLKGLLGPEHKVVTDLWDKGAKGSDRVAVEIKSTAGYAFRLATGRSGNEPPGPKIEHLIQVGLYALSPQVSAKWVHVALIDKDRNLTAEWLIGVDEPLPHLGGRTVRQLITQECERLAQLLAEMDNGDLPARNIPGFGMVDDPPSADSRDNPWNCRYCAWQPTCTTLPTQTVDGWVTAYLKKKDEAA